MKIELRKIIERYPGILENKNQFRNILKDLYPETMREVNIIINALDAGIASQISSTDIMREQDIRRHLIILEKLYGIAPQYGIEALYSWADAFDIKYEIFEINNEKLPVVSRNIRDSEIHVAGSVAYRNKQIELTYLGIELLGENDIYGMSFKFLIQNNTNNNITLYDEVIVINEIGISINTFAESPPGLKKVIGFYASKDDYKYCGINSINDFRSLVFKLYYTLDDECDRHYTDAMNLEITFI